MKRKLPIVIAITAVSGGGKTTVTTTLKKSLPNSKALFFDDYEFDGPNDIIEWINRGGNPDEWDLSPLISDMKNLLNESLEYIILDYPFGYTHSKLRDFIDIVVFIDTPLDIAMARRMIRDFKNSSTEEMLLDMKNYMTKGRLGYLHMLNHTKPSSDLVVDGTLPVSEITNMIIERILYIK